MRRLLRNAVLAAAVVLPPTAAAVYFTDTDGRMVARGNADGSGSPEVLVSHGLVGAPGIAPAVPEPGAAAATAGACAVRLGGRRRRVAFDRATPGG